MARDILAGAGIGTRAIARHVTCQGKKKASRSAATCEKNLSEIFTGRLDSTTPNFLVYTHDGHDDQPLNEVM